MFGSSVLDVAIGLIFLFMTVSLGASAITEAIASLFKLRQTTLRSGVMSLLNDPDFTGLARELYNHALINPLSKGTAIKVKDLTANPAYIDAARFSQGLLDVISNGKSGMAMPQIIASIQDQQVRETLNALWTKANWNLGKFESEIGDWFDQSMDRVSGWYKRYAQLIGFLAAFVICLLLNADAIRIAAVLWQTPSLRSELLVPNLPNAATAIETLTASSLLGWTNWNDVFDGNLLHLMRVLAGWLLVACASLLGAPFWFDTLQRIAQIAGTGPVSKTKNT